MAIELAKAYVQVVPSAKGIQGMLENEMSGELDHAGLNLGQRMGSKLVKAITGVISTAAIGKAIAETVTRGAALEQSIGGIETLFKDCAGAVKASAAEAYKTSGLSANAYMEQTTSFAASLLSSLGNNTKAAAAVADMAMTDMADNANKFGTDLQDIQNAYQGFAKQNYTMLDNLKLGYGGTQAEMQRLLNDAEKISGVHYNLGSLSDMYNAIHVIQGELDITGTTAKEASTTISGSFGSMKAAAENVLGNLALGQDLQPSLEALSETAETFLVDNLLPAITRTISGVPQIISSLVPDFLQSGTELLQSLSSGFITGIPEFLSSALPQLLAFTDELRSNFGDFVSAGIDLILSLANGIVEGLPQLFAYIPDIVINIAGLINDNAPKLLAGGAALVVALGKGVLQCITLIPQHFGKIIEATLAVISAVNWVNIGVNMMQGIANGIKGMANAVTDAFKQGVAGGLNWLKNLPSQLFNIAKNALQSFINGLTGKAIVANAATAEVALTPRSTKTTHITPEDEGIADKSEYNALIMSNLSAQSTANALKEAATAATPASTKASSKTAKAVAADTKKLANSITDTSKEILASTGNIVGSIQRVTETADNTYNVYDGTTKQLKGTTQETAKTITDTWTEVVDGTEKAIKKVTKEVTDASGKVTTTVTQTCDNVVLSVTEMQSRIDKNLSDAQSKWSSGIMGTLQSLLTNVRNGSWSGIAQNIAQLIWGEVSQEQRDIISKWAVDALDVINESYSGGGLSSLKDTLHKLLSEGITSDANESKLSVQGLSQVIDGLGESGGMGTKLAGIATSFSGMAGGITKALGSIVGFIIANPVVAAVLGLTALVGGTALASWSKNKSDSVTNDYESPFSKTKVYDSLTEFSYRASQMDTQDGSNTAQTQLLRHISDSLDEHLPAIGTGQLVIDANGVQALAGAMQPTLTDGVDADLGIRAARKARGG